MWLAVETIFSVLNRPKVRESPRIQLHVGRIRLPLTRPAVLVLNELNSRNNKLMPSLLNEHPERLHLGRLKTLLHPMFLAYLRLQISPILRTQEVKCLSLQATLSAIGSYLKLFIRRKQANRAILTLLN